MSVQDWGVQDWGAVANVAMAFAALVALVYAWWQIRSSSADSHEATAKSIRSQYLLEAIRYPTLANPDPKKMNFKKGTYDGERVKFDDYTWFVNFMLLQCDELLRLRKGADDWNWEKIVANNISYHRAYLESQAFHEEQYDVLSPRLRRKFKEMGLGKNRSP